jgi:biopolymer transport protein ExbD
MIKFKAVERETFRLDLVPMINVVFLLLIFFMLTSSASKSNMDVDLPKAVSANEVSEKNLILKVGKDGILEFDGNIVAFDMLSSALENKLKLTEKVVFEIQADKNIEFELFGKIIAVARQAGIEAFVFMTEVSNG